MRSLPLLLFCLFWPESLLLAQPLTSSREEPPAPKGDGLAPVKKPVPKPPAPLTVFPSGILDVSGRTAYLAGAGSCVEAVDLLTGDILWRTYEAQVPIQVIGDRLLVQAGVQRNRIRILTLDLKHKGEVIQESDPVVFPRWVVTGEAPAHTFIARWRVEKNVLILNWQASGWADAEEVSTHRQPSTRKQADGSARIDLESGSVEIGPAEKVPTMPSKGLPRQLQKQSVRWHKTVDRYLLALVYEEVERPPQMVLPGRQVPFVDPGTPRLYKLTLRGWDWLTGKPIPPKVVITGRQPSVLPTLDDAHLLVRDTVAPPDEIARVVAAKKAEWSIVEADSSAGEVGKLPFVPGTQSALVFDDRVYFLASGNITGTLTKPNIRMQTLYAYDLKTKKMAWEHPVAGKAIHPPGQ